MNALLIAYVGVHIYLFIIYIFYSSKKHLLSTKNIIYIYTIYTLCMYVCVYIYTHTYIHIYLHTHIYIHIYIYTHTHTHYIYVYTKASLVAQKVKNLPAMQVIWVWSLGWEDPLENGMATDSHSSSRARRIPWLKSMKLHRTGHDWVTNTHTHTHVLSTMTG